MSLRLYGTISGCGRSAGAVIPSLGSGRYAPGPNIGLPSSLKCEAPKYTINACWGQPGSLATVSHLGYADSFGLGHHPSNLLARSTARTSSACQGLMRRQSAILDASGASTNWRCKAANVLSSS